MARPLKEINWDIVEKRIEAGCTAREIAASCKIDMDTFYDRFKLEYGKSFSDYSADLYSVGDANLKFTQYVKAIAGNIPMLHLLGRERLDQGKNDDPISPRQDQIDQSHLLMQLQNEIVELKNENERLKIDLRR